MKTIFVTGDDYRHLFMIYKFSKYFNDFAWIIEKRDINLNHNYLIKKSILYKNHIENFIKIQKQYFYKEGKSFFNSNKKKIYFLDRNKISSNKFNDQIFDLIKKYRPNILISYGCQKIDIKKIKTKKIKLLNIHGGLLPDYKGVNTNFWPHYKNKSNYVGLTLHSLERKVDSGNIFFQTSVEITNKDTINTLSCKAIKNFADIVPKKILLLLKKNFYAKGFKIQSKSKLFLKKDFDPSHIHKAYENLNNFIKMKKNNSKPKLINIF